MPRAKVIEVKNKVPIWLKRYGEFLNKMRRTDENTQH